MNPFSQYSEIFTAGMKVGVGIPLPNAEVFSDGAIIHEIEEDLVSLQLSRDQLPVRVSLHVGQILELRGGSDGNSYSCRAIIVHEGYAKELLLRLIGEIVSDELREFYRIDAFLPIKYYLSHEQNPEILGKEWEKRREERFTRDLARKQRRWDSEFVDGSGELPHERLQPEPDAAEHDSGWDTIIPLAANISGGGLRIMTHQDLCYGEYVLVEILVPSPRRIIDTVVRVVFASRVQAVDSDEAAFNTGLQFVYIDERDRDAILNHISSVQMQRIRQLREKYLFRALPGDNEVPDQPVRQVDWGDVIRKVFGWVAAFLILLLLIMYFRNYAIEHPKNEIGELFENALKKYIEKHR